MPGPTPSPFQNALWEALGDRDPDQVSADDVLAAAEAKLNKDLRGIREIYSGRMARMLLDELGGPKPLS